MVAEKTRIEYSEACVEVISILNQFPEEYYNKISKKFIDFLESNKSKSYKFKAKSLDQINKNELLHETQMILLIIFYNFLATEDEKKEMIETLSENEKKYIEEQNEKYSYENIFKKEEKIENSANIELDSTLPVEYKKENLFSKIISFIKNIFKKRR